MHEFLIRPHGGKLINPIVSNETEYNDLKKRTMSMPTWTLTQRQQFDLELLMNGAFSPLTGFMKKDEYDSVCKNMRLPDGTVWPMPIVLDVPENFKESIVINKVINETINEQIVLRDEEGFPLAVLEVEEIWEADKKEEARLVFNNEDQLHPGVDYLFNKTNQYYIGGKITGMELPRHYDSLKYRLTPEEARHQFTKLGWNKIVAFQTRNPMHRAHVEITKRAADELGANLLIHPVAGPTRYGDIDYFTRVRCYEKVISKYTKGTAMLALLPLAMRMGGPREALLHAIIRKNYGCNYFIVGRDHAGPGNDSNGNPFYGPYEAQELIEGFSDEIGIKMVPFNMMVYVAEQSKYMPFDQVPENSTVLTISGTELRNRLEKGLEIPEWFSYKEVAEELRRGKPPLSERGFTVFFTGLSGSGKSTLAKGLLAKFMQTGNRPVTLLDGDVVRTNLSSELGFTKKDRSINVRRIGYVASEITKNRGIAVCAPIAPYKEDRDYNRKMISPYGGYIEVYVNTSLETCEARDVKGLYAKARKGIIKDFTGIDDPYEAPENPEIVINASDTEPEVLIQEILIKIRQLGFI